VTIAQGIQAGIDELVAAVPAPELERAARTLSDRYRAGGAEASRAARTTADVAAYLATRAPATHAAVSDVCRRARLARPGWDPSSLLDLGAGPGTASWAALAVWPGIAEVRLVEAEPAMAAAGRRLAAGGGSALGAARWEAQPLGSAGARADLVLASYLLGELDATELARFADHAWSHTADTLVVVEPGTTGGYRRILSVRDAVIASGGAVVAPCPHARACPLPDGDWCHFSTRLPRTRAHRLAKDAERGFEDEKFAYVVLARAPQPLPEARVIRRPSQRKGHVVLDLCKRDGLEQRIVSKREGATYRAARKLAWGDAL
jgi:ribosomal protein RSM22 (predicted rRNA methylase)